MVLFGVSLRVLLDFGSGAITFHEPFQLGCHPLAMAIGRVSLSVQYSDERMLPRANERLGILGVVKRRS